MQKLKILFLLNLMNKKIDKANLSVEIDDEFMKIIEHYYSTELEQSYLKTKIEKPILHEERNYEGKIVKYDIDPVSIYEKNYRKCL